MISRILSPFVLFWFMTGSVFAEDLNFKGISFGMNAAEIAKLGGGNLEFGCASAIADDDENPWTYGGIDDWNASCIDSDDEEYRTLGVSGMYQLSAIVSSHNNSVARYIGKNTYNVEELVDIFSKVFGKFDIEITVVKNGLGQEFVKKTATATKQGAVMRIADDTSGSNHEDYIFLKIISLDYVAKKAAYEAKKNSQKLKDAKSDF